MRRIEADADAFVRSVGGLKAAIHNPNVSEQAKDAAIEKLAEME